MRHSIDKAPVSGPLAPVSTDEPRDIGSALRRLALIGVALMAMQAAHAETDHAWKTHQAHARHLGSAAIPPR